MGDRSTAEPHQFHAHRYAHSHHSNHDIRDDKVIIVARAKATKCEHRLMHAAACSENDGSHTSETVAALIQHLEQHSMEWVKNFAAAINGGDSGLTQKFAFHRTEPYVGDARNDPNTALAILEKYGS